jgi:uroporphyrinogen decarboxylase
MRQAGRYMPQYRAIRAKHSFLEMCHDPELAAEITQLPLRVFGFDAAILFSDILVIPEALGVGLRFEEQKGPIIERPLQTLQDIEQLPKPDMEQALGYVKKAIELLRPQLKVPLLGFCGAPFTVASYMIEGGASRDLKKTKQWMLREPASFHRLLDHIATCTIEYINLQADAGVHALQFFDSWAHVLSHGQFREFSLPYLAKLKAGLKKPLPVILFCRGSSVFAPDLAELTPAAISVDWNGDMARVRSVVPPSIALQGNLDPDFLYAPRKLLQTEIKRLLKQMKGDPGYIFNLGHGIHPDVSPEAVQTLVETVQGA